MLSLCGNPVLKYLFTVFTQNVPSGLFVFYKTVAKFVV